MFLRFIIRALQFRKQRLALSFSALAIGAALATVLFGIYGTVERKMRDEFRGYGANIAAVPLNGKTVPLGMVQAAEKLGASAAPFLVTSARGNVVVGFDPAKSQAMTAYWHVEGSRDIGTGECIAGESLAASLHLSVGNKTALDCTVKGIVSTGGDEDRELLVPFAAAADLASIHDVASLVEIRAPGERVEEVRAALAKEFPAADVRTMRAVAETESSVVLKIRASLFLLTLVILTITTLCVTSNFSEMVIERSKEIGILKALGGMERKIAALFVSESAVLAVAATVAGYVIGLFAAAWIGQEVFGGVFHVQADWLVFGGVAGVMLTVAAVATGIAASRIWSVQPAIILRGE
jgi:putative ABC transport system permease protein